MRYDDAELQTNHTSHLSFARPEQNKKLRKLLHHFRR